MKKNKYLFLISCQVIVFITLVSIGSMFQGQQVIYTKPASLQGPCPRSTVSGSSNPSGDEWSMFHRACNHTGTVSTAPLQSTNQSWNYLAGGQVWSSPAVAGGRVYVGSDNGSICCLNATTGKFSWSYSANDSFESSPAVADGRVYIGCNNSVLYCLNVTTGKSVWNYSTGDSIFSSPGVRNGYVYFGSADDNIYCLNATTGLLSWKNSTGGEILSSPAISSTRVYVGSNDDNIYCYNATTGNLIWLFPTSNRVESSPAVTGGRLYVGSFDGKIYCLNSTTGAQIWNFPTGGAIFSSPAIDSASGHVYVGSLDGKIYCLNSITGSSIWNYTTSGQVWSSPAVSGVSLYMGSDDNKIYCLSAANGKLNWSYTVSNSVKSSPALSSGRVYVGSLDQTLYCLPMVFLSVPQNLQATSGNACVLLTWTKPTSEANLAITNYTIYRGTSSGSETFLIEIGNVTTYNDTGLTNGQIYYYKIAAANGAGIGAMSTEVSTTPATVPTTPLTLAVSSTGDAWVYLTWTAPYSNGGSGITNYAIYRGTISNGEVLLTTIGNVLLYNDTGLTNGQQYYYKVAAVNAKGTGSQSSEVSGIPATVPTAPLSLAVSSTGNGWIYLTWITPANNGGSGITSYAIYRGTASNGEVLLTTIGNVLLYNDTGLTNGQQYYYKVAALNGKGTGAQSNEVNGIPATVPTAPRTPAATGQYTAIYLTWVAPADNGGSSIIGYRIYRGTLSGTEKFFIAIAAQLFYNNTGLANGVTYYYIIQAVNGKGNGANSTETSATSVTTPSAPQSFQAAAGDKYVYLSWIAPANNGGSAITGYRIYRGTTLGGETLLVTVGVMLDYNNTGLTDGTTYYYIIQAVNIAGRGVNSTETNAKPVATINPPGAPTGLSIQATGNGFINLTWSAPSSNGGSPVINYSIYRGSSPGSEMLVATIGNVTTYSDNGLTNGNTYYYKVAAVNTKGTGAKSNEVSGSPRATAPLAPQALMVALSGNGFVNLTWSAPANNGGSVITKYSIYRGLTSGSEAWVANTTVPVLTYNDTGLTNGQAYYYKVAAVNLIGTGSQSNEVSATPLTVPSAPQSLAVASTGNGWVYLIWSSPASTGGLPVTNYHIYRGTSSGTETPLAFVGAVLYYNNTGLTNGQTYYYKIAAMNAKGFGPQSNEANGVPATVPTAPQTLNIPSTGNKWIYLTWSLPESTGGASITKYSIYRGSTSGSEAWVANTTGPVLTYNDTGLTNGQTYYYKIAAVNGKGVGAQSSEVSATPATVPGPPLSFTAIGENGEVILNWTAPASNGGNTITNYRIYRGTTPGGEKLITTIGLQFGFINTGLTNGQSYYYMVAAVNNKGAGANSTEENAIPGYVPSAPQTLSVTAGNMQVMLNWTTPLTDNGYTITNYAIYRGTFPASYALIATLGVVFGYVDSGLTNGITYYYMVAANNSRGIGANSEERNATPATTPGAPRSFTVIRGNMFVNLTWSAPANNGGSAINGYKVFQGTTPNGETLYATIGPSKMNFTIAGLTNGHVYYFKVAAVNAMGVGTNATEISMTPATVPDAPQKLTATASTNQVVLTWQVPGNNGGAEVTNYMIYRGTTSSGEVFIVEVTNVLTWTDTNVTGGQLYYYRVSAVTIAGEGMQSSESSATPTSSGNPSPFGGLSSGTIIIIIGCACVVGIVVIASAGVAARKKKAVARSRANAPPAKSMPAGKELKQLAWIQPATTGPLALEEVKARLKHFFVFHAKTGICLFYQPFIETTIDPQLIAGFISAISKFGETFEKEAELKVLEYKSFKILLEETVVCKYALLFSGEVNDELNELLKGFIGEFESRFRNSLVDFNGDMSMFKLASEIISNVFKMTVPRQNMAMTVDKGPKKRTSEEAAQFNLYCPKCELWLVRPGTSAVSGSETCPKCNQPLYFVPKCDNCGNGFIKPLKEFNAFKNSPRTCEKCGGKMRIQ